MSLHVLYMLCYKSSGCCGKLFLCMASIDAKIYSALNNYLPCNTRNKRNLGISVILTKETPMLKSVLVEKQKSYKEFLEEIAYLMTTWRSVFIKLWIIRVCILSRSSFLF